MLHPLAIGVARSHTLECERKAFMAGIREVLKASRTLPRVPAVVKQLAQPNVEVLFDRPSLQVGYRMSVSRLQEALVHKPVSVLVTAQLLQLIGLRKVVARGERRRHRHVPSEILAVVGGKHKDRLRALRAFVPDPVCRPAVRPSENCTLPGPVHGQNNCASSPSANEGVRFPVAREFLFLHGQCGSNPCLHLRYRGSCGSCDCCIGLVPVPILYYLGASIRL